MFYVSLEAHPFVGVGSTLVAAKELGKDAVGIEISPEFATIAEILAQSR